MQRPLVTLRDVWAVVKASAIRRLGMPLLIAYAVLAAVGVVDVAQVAQVICRATH